MKRKPSSVTLEAVKSFTGSSNGHSRSANVVCTTAIFPEGFEVDGDLQLKRGGSAAAMSFAVSQKGPTSSPASGGAGGRLAEPSMGDSISVMDDFSGDGQLHQGGVFAQHFQSLSHVENQCIVQQVQYNVELMKHKLFQLLSMNVLPMEEEASMMRITELQGLLDSTAGSAASWDSVPSLSSAAGAQLQGNTSRPATPKLPGSRPVSASQPSKVFKETTWAVDTSFRYAFEEVALRWQGLQDRPFSLRAFHETAKHQINSREAALKAKGLAEQTAKRCIKEANEVKFELEKRDEHHTKAIQALLTENRVMQQRIYDLQQKLRVQDEPMPQLYEGDKKADVVPGQEGVVAPPVDPNEKHYELVNRRLTEECALLTHTLEQRNNMIKSMHTELQSTKMQMANTKDEFRKYVQEQDQMDSEMRKTFAQNEATTEKANKERDEAVAKMKEAKKELSELEESVGALYDRIAILEASQREVTAERDHLRSTNESLTHEAESAKEALGVLEQKASNDALIAAQAIAKLEERVHELENDGSREKLERALQEIAQQNERITKLQRAVESRDKQIATLRQEHKEEINKLEEKMALLRSEMEVAAAKSEELLLRERQKGLDLAERRVAEAREEFAVQSSLAAQELEAAEKIQTDMAHELMLFHRQSSILEQFLRDYLEKEQLRILAKLMLRRDLRNFTLSSGGESDAEFLCAPIGPTKSLPDEQPAGFGCHTPRTRLYFGQHRLFDPLDVQDRLTIASEAMESTRTDQHTKLLDGVDPKEAPVIPADHPTAPAALLLKSKLTVEFLENLCEREDERRSLGKALTNVAPFVSPEEKVITLTTRLSRANSFAGGGSTEGSAKEQALSALFHGPKLTLEHQQQMVLEEMKSKLTAARLKAKALEDELHLFRDGEGLMMSTKAANSRPSSADALNHASSSRRRPVSAHSLRGKQHPDDGAPNNQNASFRGSESEASALGYGIDDDVDSMGIDQMSPLHRGNSGVAMRSSNTSMPGVAVGQQQSIPSSSFFTPASVTQDHSAPRHMDKSLKSSSRGIALQSLNAMMPNRGETIADEFPGIHHASEFLDLFESYQSLKGQLAALVEICAEDALRGAADPDDLDRAQELLHAKFSVFRAVEAHNNIMLSRLHKKKEDVMRRREEELEKVLGAMQNISLTHPKESQKLLDVAKSAARQRLRGIPSSEAAAFAGVRASSPMELSAVVVRPVSSQSLRRLAPIPGDVVVSGASALMTLRSRSASSNRKNGKKQGVL